jgi:hypothetical protein
MLVNYSMFAWFVISTDPITSMIDFLVKGYTINAAIEFLGG